MSDIRFTSVIRKHQWLGGATLGASVVPSKLLFAFLFSDPDVSVQYSKNLGLIRSSMMCCKCGSEMPCCVDTSRKDGYRWRSRGKTFFPVLRVYVNQSSPETGKICGTTYYIATNSLRRLQVRLG